MRIENPTTNRLARLAGDFIVLLMVLDASLAFVDFHTHPIVAMIFVWASTCGALRQLIARRGAPSRERVESGRQYAWAFVGIAWWVAAMLPALPQFAAWHVPPMPFPVQAVGAVCLVFAMATPFLRIPHLSRGAFDAYPHAIGSVLLTGSPMLALLVGAWLMVTAGTALGEMRALRISRAAAPLPIVLERAA